MSLTLSYIASYIQPPDSYESLFNGIAQLKKLFPHIDNSVLTNSARIYCVGKVEALSPLICMIAMLCD